MGMPEQIHPLIIATEVEVASVKKLLAQQLAPHTRRVYRSDFHIFSEWCQARNVDSLNVAPELIALFLAAQFERGFHPKTLDRRVAAIRYAYKCLGKDSPTDHELVKGTMKGIRRDENAPLTRHKNALTNNLLMHIMQFVPLNNIRGIRDRAILLLGFAGAFRRSELVNIHVEDVVFQQNKGADIHMRKTKNNQEGKPEVKAIAQGKVFCPILALKTWMTEAKIIDGAVFRALTRTNRITNKAMNDNSIYYLIKHYTQLAGFPISEFSPHSLRAGFITSSLEKGSNIFKVMDVTLHKSTQTLKAYARFAERYKEHAGEGLL